MIGLGLGLGFSAPVAASGGGGGELFPDPTLADVANSALWTFDPGAPEIGPSGGTGPGITLDGSAEALAFLTASGALNAAFAAAVGIGATVSVSLTIANFTAANGSFGVKVRLSDAVDFTPSGNGVITHNVVAGAGTEADTCFTLTGEVDPADFEITAISVTAA